VSGGLEPSWAITAGVLPKGLKLDPASGTITGVPRRAGSSAFTVTVTDSLGARVTIRYTLLVRR